MENFGESFNGSIVTKFSRALYKIVVYGSVIKNRKNNINELLLIGTNKHSKMYVIRRFLIVRKSRDFSFKGIVTSACLSVGVKGLIFVRLLLTDYLLDFYCFLLWKYILWKRMTTVGCS